MAAMALLGCLGDLRRALEAWASIALRSYQEFHISAEFCTDSVPMQTDEGEILEEGSSKMEHEDFVMEGHGKTPPPGEENKQEKEQEKEEQLMEDKKRKKEDKKKKESTQKVTDQKTKVPEATKTSLSQPVAASPIGSSPSPPINGGNNAKRVAVPNGQPPSAARYMPREVPPRFRCQQDHKVLLKRGQPPPPSCMLLGSGVGPTSSPAPGANPNNAQPVTGVLLPCDSGTATDSTTGGAAASNYANSTWGPGVSSNSTNVNPTHVWDKVIVDGSDMEEWPCIASKDTESSSENSTDNNSASTSSSEKSALLGSTSSNKGKGNQCQSGSSAPQPPGNGRLPNSNWNSGPQSTVSKDEEPSGWEEPSPQSISRKMDIDDGTSAWGDPNSYNYKNVNLWDKNSQSGQASREQNLPPPRPSKVTASVWNKSTPPAPDNGTAAWGEPNEASPGWGEVEDAGTSTTWGNGSSSASNAIKSNSKSPQDGWGDNDGPVSGTRHSSWEEEEEGGVWNTAGSQGSNSSHNSTSWGQGGKKPQIKCSLKGGSSDSWMNTLSDQISNMGLL
ncbi:trinucleotide repeat-containing 6B protein, partial [Crotalus adamanteus]